MPESPTRRPPDPPEPPPGNGRVPRRRSARVALFLVIQLMLAVVLAEVALRVARNYNPGIRQLLHRSSMPGSYEEAETLEELINLTPLGFVPYEPRLGYYLNSRSLRTPEYETAKPDGTFRIVLLGDSFTFASGGVPFSDHWPRLLARDLPSYRGKKVEVINLGMPAVEPKFLRRMWQIEGSKLDADLVILAFYIGNDFNEESKAEQTSNEASGLWERLEEVSMLARALRGAMLLRGVERTRNPPPPAQQTEPSGPRSGGYEIEGYAELYDPLRPTFKEDTYVKIASHSTWLYHQNDLEAFRRRFRAVKETLTALHQEVSDAGADLLVMLIPDDYQINPELRRSVYSLTNTREEDFDLSRPQRALQLLFEREGIDWLDPLPEFLSESESQLLYKPRDTHWNTAGNALAAQLLVEHLRQAEGESR